MRKILVADISGSKTIQADHLATFTTYIQGVAYQFAVTRTAPCEPVKVTHKLSGFSLCAIDGTAIAAALNDYKIAGQAALKSLCNLRGEARIASALRAKEA